MREVFAAFGSEVFRPLMSILLPGLVALSTTLIALVDRFEGVRKFADSRHLESGIVLFLAALAIGEILEDVGTRIEHRFDNKARGYNPDFEKEWYDYLGLSFAHEPVGHRYLRTLVVRLKFQFGLSLALLCSAFGTPFTPMERWAKVATCCVQLIASGYLMYEAKETHALLGQVRHELLARFGPKPQPENAAAATAAK